MLWLRWSMIHWSTYRAFADILGRTSQQGRADLEQKLIFRLFMRRDRDRFECAALMARTINRKKCIVLTSVPYGLNKSNLVEKIAQIIVEKKVPQLVDIRDESTEDIRVILELRRGAEPKAAMAYLYRHTPLEQNFSVNLTCLVPTENP